eukprot:CAMPEP_0201477910 /NCGR_PEP_ID=MMETSP0151_2-20130828/2853_1 /ASSEMBLY_ACC=CAM_ASM_000257 /TAXON_ID=200890 /ORGANISM="Paramoeba atlantica, Strain 621/1 / CCAP 1560/9" /LENGTH=294 /DNA_ID=CAMNT_0047858789 /DNA_START=80 /DNA_END=964 /DNA_ORIENTATION=+
MEQNIQTQHTDMIHDAQVDYYGKLLATASSDRSIKIFDISSAQTTHLCDITGHEGPVWQVAWGHPKYGVVLASCSYDRTVRIWRQDQGKLQWNCLHVCQMSLSVNSISWAPPEHGLLLAAASSDGSISIIQHKGDSWIESRIPEAHQIGVNAVSWRPVNSSFGASPPKQFVTGGCDNMVRIWKFDETGDWTRDGELEFHQDWVRDVAWAPNIGIPYELIASCSQNGQVVVWVKDDQGKWNPKPLEKFDEPVWRVSWSVTGGILAISSGENNVTLWKESIGPDGERRWQKISKAS